MREVMYHSPNRTAADAHARITPARIGSLIRPSETYLLTLRQLLYSWLEGIEEELAKLPAQED